MNTNYTNTSWRFNDGGRLAAGYKGTARDCVTRAIAIATGKPYEEVRRKIDELAEQHCDGSDSQHGVHRPVYTEYLTDLGWQWTPTMGIGTGCTVHLRADELPAGMIIAKTSKHLVAVRDGVIHDTHDSSRLGTRCVYGYWHKKIDAPKTPAA